MIIVTLAIIRLVILAKKVPFIFVSKQSGNKIYGKILIEMEIWHDSKRVLYNCIVPKQGVNA